jgi:hypothetical protein
LFDTLVQLGKATFPEINSNLRTLVPQTMRFLKEACRLTGNGCDQGWAPCSLWAHFHNEGRVSRAILAAASRNGAPLPDPEVLLLQCLLHDTGRLITHDPSEHGLAGQDLLAAIGFPPIVTDVCQQHLFSGTGPVDRTPPSPEEVPLSLAILVISDMCAKTSPESGLLREGESQHLAWMGHNAHLFGSAERARAQLALEFYRVFRRRLEDETGVNIHDVLATLNGGGTREA